MPILSWELSWPELLFFRKILLPAILHVFAKTNNAPLADIKNYVVIAVNPSIERFFTRATIFFKQISFTVAMLTRKIRIFGHCKQGFLPIHGRTDAINFLKAFNKIAQVVKTDFGGNQRDGMTAVF